MDWQRTNHIDVDWDSHLYVQFTVQKLTRKIMQIHMGRPSGSARKPGTPQKLTILNREVMID